MDRCSPKSAFFQAFCPPLICRVPILRFCWVDHRLNKNQSLKKFRLMKTVKLNFLVLSHFSGAQS